MSSRNVFFIHAAGDPRHPEGSGQLADYLARELGDGWDVMAPTMPEPDEPHYRPWRDEIEQHLAGLAGLDGDPLLVGHSFGGSVLLKYLAEGTYVRPIPAVFLVSVPFWGPEFRDFALPEDFADNLPSAPIFLYHSRDDPEVPASHLRRYQEHLPDATTRIIEGSQHSFTDGLPELVRDIRATVTGR
jgi:serine hydrolase